MKWTLCFLLMTSPILAADLPVGSQIEVIDSFGGGLDTLHQPHDVAKGFSPHMGNVFVHRVPKTLIKRPGYVVAGTTLTLTKISLGLTFYHEDGSKEYIVSDDSVVLTTKDYNTYVLVSSALNNSVHLEASQIRNKIWFTNGSNPVFTWDSSNKQNLDGTNGTPNVPRFKYISYYQERVFGLNTSGNTASLYWSDVASTAGVAIAPDSYLAWPPGNSIAAGQGDGQQGTALWVYRGQLQIGKERSIWTLYGTNTASYVPRQTEKQAGVVSQDSIVGLDGLTYYKGYDGIYAYNAVNSQRISDIIKTDVDAMRDPILNTVDNVWDSQTDFNKGSFYGSTTTPDGFLTIISTTYGNVGTGLIPPGFVTSPAYRYISPDQGVGTDAGTANLQLNPSTTFYGPIQLFFNSPRPLPDNAKLVLNDVALPILAPYGGPVCGVTFTSMTFVNRFNGEMLVSTNYVQTGDGYNHWSFQHQNLVMDGVHINNSSISIKIDGCGLNFDGFVFSPPRLLINFVTASTAEYLSDVTTITTINAWSNFNANNSGNVQYYFRTSTSAVNITTKTWINIGVGSVPNEPVINNFIQWGATLTAQPNSSLDPSIDFVRISHIEGQGSSSRALGIDWKNEFWLSVSTDLTSNTRLQYVKAWATSENPLAWNLLSGIDIASLWKDGNTTLYGGSSSTGTIFRLDYGTNDNGMAIDSFYDTPQLNLDSSPQGNWIQKQLSEIRIDADNESSTLKLGTSVDGKDFVTENIDLTGNSRILKVLYNHNEVGKYFQFRFRNNDLNKNLVFNSLGIVYQSLRTR